MPPPRDLGRIAGPIVIPTCIEVDLIWNLPWGKQVKNALHGSVAGAFNATAAVAQAIYAALIGSAAWTTWAGQMPTQASLQGVQLRDLRTVNMPFVISTGALTPGTSITGGTPPGSSLTVTQRTALAGRSNRGRVYLPCLAQVALLAATGNATAAAQAAAAGLINQLQTTLLANGVTLAIANPARQAYTGRTGRAIPARPAAVVTVTTNVVRGTALTSQRRRSLVA